MLLVLFRMELICQDLIKHMHRHKQCPLLFQFVYEWSDEKNLSLSSEDLLEMIKNAMKVEKKKWLFCDDGSILKIPTKRDSTDAQGWIKLPDIPKQLH